MLRLLIPATSSPLAGQFSIKLLGSRWILTEILGHTTPAHPKYTCVSYAWGSETVEHPLNAQETMSARTVEAAEAAVRDEEPTALWVDALCVPLEEPARSVCLSQMGAIYGQASTVVVVLSAQCSVLLRSL